MIFLINYIELFLSSSILYFLGIVINTITLTEEELVPFCSALDRTELLQDFAFTIINFLFYTGLRFSEMQVLQWKDLDSEQKCINISKDLYYKNSEHWSFDDLKNKHSKRSMTLDNITYQMLLD